MTSQSVCAVIVTYHPAVKMLEHMRAVLAQVQELIVVDNGSNSDEVAALRIGAQSLGFHLCENGKNLGIAQALNQGVRWAKERGYAWVILFDQDSKITEGFVREMFAAWDSHPLRQRVAAIHPRYVNPDTGIELWVPRAADGSPILPMTSGTLMPLWIFDRIGWFASEYFIDLVDWEYSLRIRVAGFCVADSNRAKLSHSPGDPTKVTILGRVFEHSRHNAVRRYYIWRNGIALHRKYLLSFPLWLLKATYRQLHDTVICLIVDENRASQFRSVVLGTWDGLIGRMGKREGL
jgi:rhamnosyltransferase